MAKDSILDISKILEEYSYEIQDGITELAEEIANEGKNKLKNNKSTYKIRTGDYNKGWRVKTEKGARYVHTTIHNATDYQLTHLLENGHATRNGGHTRAFKHIEPVADDCTEKFEREVEELIKRGGK